MIPHSSQNQKRRYPSNRYFEKLYIFGFNHELFVYILDGVFVQAALRKCKEDVMNDPSMAAQYGVKLKTIGPGQHLICQPTQKESLAF